MELRNEGLAQLENEKSADAAETFETLTRAAPEEPLAWANLAIARLRSQDTDGARAAIDKALELDPKRPRLLAVRADIEQWSGDQEAALATYLEAATGAPDDVEIQYALYRLATTMTADAADAAVDLALGNLARLRPDNLVVMLHLGQRAVASGDRAGATRAFQRVGELLWQAPPIAAQAMARLTTALESGEPGAARTPAQQLNNVLLVTPMYQQGLRELVTGIQGLPLLRFDGEAPLTSFGEGVDVRFVTAPLTESAAAAGALADADFDAY